MNRLIICILGLMFSVSLYSQSEFSDFLNRFPVVSWSQLDSLIQEKWETKVMKDPIPLSEANRNIWYDDEVGISHVKNRKGDYPPPYLRMADRKYFTTDVCGYYLGGTVYPICKYYLSPDIVMIVLLYTFEDWEIGRRIRYNIDAFTFNLKEEQMCSALCLYNFPHLGAGLSPVYRAYLDNDHNVTCLRYTYSVDGPEVLFVSKYRLAEDGYIDYLDSYKSNFVHAEVIDADGYVNLREKPNTKSKILTTINSGTYVVLELIENSNWYRVRDYDSDKDEKKYRNGYLYKDRVKIISLYPDKEKFSFEDE